MSSAPDAAPSLADLWVALGEAAAHGQVDPLTQARVGDVLDAARPLRTASEPVIVHDLPPRWDGRRVRWSAWRSAAWSSFAYHAPLTDRACTACGVLDEGAFAIGRVDPEPGTTVEAVPIARLTASRCPCGRDVVHDVTTGESWVLDESDYTDAGSWPDAPDEMLF